MNNDQETLAEDKPKLGFGSSPDATTWVFVGGDDDDESGSAWYTRNFDTEVNTPLEHSSLTGYLKNIYIKKTEYKKKANYKMNLRMQADQRYNIRSGLSTFFSRGFLLAIEVMMDNEVDFDTTPLIISVRKGNDNNVVFCNVFNYTTGAKIFYTYDGDKKLVPIINRLQEYLGVTVQTKDMIDNPEKYKDEYKEQQKEQRRQQPSLDLSDDELAEKAEKDADDIFGVAQEDPEIPVVSEAEVTLPKGKGQKRKAK